MKVQSQATLGKRMRQRTLAFFSHIKSYTSQRSLHRYYHDKFIEVEHQNQHKSLLLEQYRDNLKDTHDLLDSVMDSVDDGILSLFSNGSIEVANDAACRIFGYQMAEIKSSNIATLITDPYQKKLRRYLSQRNAVEAKQFDQDMIGRKRDGSYFPIRLTSMRVDRRNMFICVIRDISQLKHLEMMVGAAAEEERFAIGCELHDNINQRLAGLSLKARSVALNKKAKGDAEWEWFDNCSNEIQLIVSDVRKLVHDLNPVTLQPGVLASALSRMIEQQQSLTSSTIKLSIPKQLPELSHNVENQFYRIAQEAVHNAIKHADASVIQVKLEKCEDFIELSIVDNGNGRLRYHLDHQDSRGLHIMRYRAGLIGAKLILDSTPEHGSRVDCILFKNLTSK